MTGHVIVLGATSAMAEATARLYAAEGASLTLVGRQAERLEAIAADLKARGASAVDTAVEDLGQAKAPAKRLSDWAGGRTVDAVLLFYGVLGDQARAESDLDHAAEVLQVDFTSAALWSLAAASLLEGQGRGALVVVGSVAGDRGRQSNYVYGAAKGGLGVLVQGIAHRLALRNSGARAVLVKPGFVDTPMTDRMAKGGPLWATPEAVAKIVRRAAERGGPVQYAPGFWRLIMLVIRVIPSAIFHKRPL
ncbi:SDR family NAD(P)-dependent oxidoreductase [Phenylobacterium sp.]|jgi:short-subunit dehydrogenase|uniref:SDR family NAD(P)-dependent oxidoreductase n=1 Tax=Phenylobacterium sp. TaxID=1871053 RepID=UPI002F951DD0